MDSRVGACVGILLGAVLVAPPFRDFPALRGWATSPLLVSTNVEDFFVLVLLGAMLNTFSRTTPRERANPALPDNRDCR